MKNTKVSHISIGKKDIFVIVTSAIEKNIKEQEAKIFLSSLDL